MIDAAAYGKALFELAEESGEAARVSEELELVREALRANREYVTLLDTPAVPTAEKLNLLQESFGAAQPMLRNFLCLLCEKRSVYALPACADAYRAAFDEAHNILRADAITALPMREAQQTALREKLERITGKTVLLSNHVDPALLGGVRLRYGGAQLDGSIQARLDRLRRSLSETVVS